MLTDYSFLDSDKTEEKNGLLAWIRPHSCLLSKTVCIAALRVLSMQAQHTLPLQRTKVLRP